MTMEVYNPYEGFSAEMPARPARSGGADIPYIRICQPASIKPLKEGIPLGNFYLTTRELDDESGEEIALMTDIGTQLQIVPLGVNHRRYKADGKGDDWQIVCRSFNGVTCEGKHAAEAQGQAIRCPHIHFGRDKSGQATAPACTEVLRFILMTDKAPEPVTFDFSKTAAQAGWDVADACRDGRIGNAGWVMGLEWKQNKSGTQEWCVPTLTPLPADRIAQLAQAGVTALNAGKALPDPAEKDSKPAYTPPPAPGYPEGDIDDLPF